MKNLTLTAEQHEFLKELLETTHQMENEILEIRRDDGEDITDEVVRVEHLESIIEKLR